jgi:superoxide oxidase
MQFRDNGLRYSRVTIVLHWLVAILLFSIIGLSLAIAQGGDYAQKLEWTHVRNLLGTVLFFVSLYRFWARVTSYHPLPLGTPNPVEVIVSRSVAAALALAMVLLPIAAWLSQCAAGEIVWLPGGLAIPAPFEANAEAHRVFAFLFNLGATAFLAGLALHIFGAFKNHWILKNDVLRRMLGKHVEL